jgi:hypothetical protein
MPRVHRPATVAAAVALPLALAAGIITAAVITQHRQDPGGTTGPVAVGAVPAPAASSPACTGLLAALPDTLGDATKAQLAAPAPAGAVAWHSPKVDEPLVLRCGIERPAEFTTAAALVVVNGVQWLQISGAASGLKASTWVVVDRGVYVAITLPDGTGSAPLQDAAEAVKKALPAQPLDPAPVR